MAEHLPDPATNTDFYLYAIAVQIRTMNELLTQLTAVMQQPVQLASDVVALREPEPPPASKPKRRHRGKPVGETSTGQPFETSTKKTVGSSE